MVSNWIVDAEEWKQIHNFNLKKKNSTTNESGRSKIKLDTRNLIEDKVRHRFKLFGIEQDFEQDASSTDININS